MLYAVNIKNLRTFVLITSFIIVFLVFSLWIFNGKVRFLEFQHEENQVSRTQLTTEAIKSGISNPVNGLGIQGINVVNDVLQKEFPASTRVNHAHNLFAQTFLEQGILGLSVLCGFFFLGIYAILRQKNRVLGVILICIFSFNLGDYLFYYAPFQIAFWMTLHSKSRKTNISSNLPLRHT